jgi:hypothetical protein
MIRSLGKSVNDDPIVINYYDTRKKAEEVKEHLNNNDKDHPILYDPDSYIIEEVPDEEYNNISYKSGFSKNYYKSVR